MQQARPHLCYHHLLSCEDWCPRRCAERRSRRSWADGSSRGREGGRPMDIASSTGRSATALVAATLAFAPLMLGCGGPNATKAGKATAPVVLRMANESADLSYEPAVASF